MSFDRDAFVRSAEALAQRLGAMPADAFCRWGGGERRADGAVTMPFPVYDAVEDAFWSLLGTVGLATAPADYQAWFAASGASDEDPAYLARAGLEDVAMTALRIRRAERFCDGFIAGAFACGFLIAILNRLVELRDELPYQPARSPWRAPFVTSAR